MIHRLYTLLVRIWRPQRWKRLRRQLDLCDDESVVDIGGTVWFWERLRPCPPKLVITNLDPGALRNSETSNIAHVQADGCRLPFADGEFDLAFSNSVIEHVGCRERQVEFAREVCRVGRKVWVQTPAREFPIEPHFLGLGIHWLPARRQPFAARWLSVRGWIDRTETEKLSKPGTIRLLSRQEMQELFPDCTIDVERFLGLPKSYIARRQIAQQKKR